MKSQASGQSASNRKEVEFITGKIRDEYVNAAGLLSGHFPPDGTHLLNDLNDYLPFLSWYGHDDFVRQQLSVATEYAIDGLMPVGNRILSWRQDEWLGALWGQFEADPTSELASLIELGLKTLDAKLNDRGIIKAFHNLETNASPAVFDPRTGALLETLLDISNNFPQAQEIALDCLDKLVEWSQTYQQWLIPNFVFYTSSAKTKISKFNPFKMPQKVLYPYIDGVRSSLGDMLVGLPFGRQIKLAKQNSNLVHSFIRAYERTGRVEYWDFVSRWFGDFTKFMYRDGQCFSGLNNRFKGQVVKLSHNHPVVEICLEIVRITGNTSYLAMGERIVEYWLSKRMTNGLFPAFGDVTYAFLDDQTDLVVLFVKLYRVLASQKYLDYANTLYKAIIVNFMCADGLARYSYLNGKKFQKRIVTPKYNALFLKASIALDHADQILEDHIWAILRDR